ncbi:unnamed protein product [Dimorphilus gyrociliatus]|uniref:Uncharacterized protein n=1 Tax=Dimorphilus gyrociliatus TaxID=2664684 RepID=A0A7I8W4H6_9ANNE|nr:unnamed protein product [Dimorphilus gyrociliatus]
MTSANNQHLNDILRKEEEYRRLNEELEAKTAQLVQEADLVLRSPSSSFSKPSLLSKIDSDDFFEWNDEEDYEIRKARPTTQSRNQLNKSVSKAKTKPAIAKKAAKPLKSQLSEEYPSTERNNDAEIRFFKAKIRVLQEEINRSGQELAKKRDKTFELTSKQKSLEDELNKTQKTVNSQAATLQKLHKLADEAKSKVVRVQTEVETLKNKTQNLRKVEKKINNNQGSLDVQLQKALDDAKKYRDELHVVKSNEREGSVHDKRQLKGLLSENQSLEKSKKEMISIFNKNMKLIELLRKQKSLLETVKTIPFTESEFARIIGW